MEVDTRRQMGGRNGGRHQEKNGGRHQETNGGRHQETNGRSKWRSTPGEKRRLHFPPNLMAERTDGRTNERTDGRTNGRNFRRNSGDKSISRDIFNRRYL